MWQVPLLADWVSRSSRRRRHGTSAQRPRGSEGVSDRPPRLLSHSLSVSAALSLSLSLAVSLSLSFLSLTSLPFSLPLVSLLSLSPLPLSCPPFCSNHSLARVLSPIHMSALAEPHVRAACQRCCIVLVRSLSLSSLSGARALSHPHERTLTTARPRRRVPALLPRAHALLLTLSRVSLARLSLSVSLSLLSSFNVEPPLVLLLSQT